MSTQVVIDNGVNVEALLGAREALTEAPEAAAFVWRVVRYLPASNPLARK